MRGQELLDGRYKHLMESLEKQRKAAKETAKSDDVNVRMMYTGKANGIEYAIKVIDIELGELLG